MVAIETPLARQNMFSKGEVKLSNIVGSIYFKLHAKSCHFLINMSVREFRKIVREAPE